MSTSINRYTLSTGLVLAIPGGTETGRLVLRFTEDTKVSLSQGEIDFNYIMFQGNTVIILDPPNLLSTSNLWVELDSASSGFVEVLRC
jgi:hypothetical protein